MEQNLDCAAAYGPFGLALELAAPGVTGAALRALFDDRPSRQDLYHWKTGRRAAPAWAIERISQINRERALAVEQHLAATKKGPGRKAGAINLARYLARR